MQQRPVHIHIQHWEQSKKEYSAPKELTGINEIHYAKFVHYHNTLYYEP